MTFDSTFGLTRTFVSGFRIRFPIQVEAVYTQFSCIKFLIEFGQSFSIITSALLLYELLVRFCYRNKALNIEVKDDIYYPLNDNVDNENYHLTEFKSGSNYTSI